VELLFHPERNSGLILRADILSDGAPLSASKDLVEYLSEDFVCTRNIVRRLVPRQPNRDPSLDQDCTFFVRATYPSSTGVEDGDDEECLIIISPRIDENTNTVPWYHPPVRHLSFRYFSNPSGEGNALIRIGIVPLVEEQNISDIPVDTAVNAGHLNSAGVDPTSRLYRTCLSLLETAYKYGKGKATGYRKRVVHDVRPFSLRLLLIH
jgi:tRNASer (uridine44-2'-O)-methyltransferase